MVSISTITYWCYITAVLVQGFESLGFIIDPPRMITVASDSYAQFFIRVTGICLLPLTQFFWGFRHIPFQGGDATHASYSHGCARLFAKFHTLISLLLCYAMYQQGVSIPHGQCLLGMHLTWATIMAYALVQHHHNVHGYIIDTTSVPAAAKSFKALVKGEDEPTNILQMIKGEDDEPTTVLQFMIKGEDSSSKSVLQMFQDEIKTD